SRSTRASRATPPGGVSGQEVSGVEQYVVAGPPAGRRRRIAQRQRVVARVDGAPQPVGPPQQVDEVTVAGPLRAAVLGAPGEGVRVQPSQRGEHRDGGTYGGEHLAVGD